MDSVNQVRSYYHSLDLPQKFNFFEEDFWGHCSKLNDRELGNFLKEVVLDKSENSSIRKQVVEIHTELILLKKLKPRHGASLLIDSWQDSGDVFLESRRLKDLFLFYEEDPEQIKEIYELYSQHDEAEIQSESLFQLGLVTLLEALRSQEPTCLDLLQRSNDYFLEASQCIENRTDADFFYVASKVLIDFLIGRTIRVKFHLRSLAEILWKREIFSFSGLPNKFVVGFYNVLASLESIKNLLDSTWLDYRNGFDKLHYYICEIKNAEVRGRLFESNLRIEFSCFVENQLFEPYFALSKNAELSKIRERLVEVEEGTDAFYFLKDLEEILKGDLKKKLLLINTLDRFRRLWFWSKRL